MEAVIRGWIGEVQVEDQQRIEELTAQVQRLQQERGPPAGAAGPQTKMGEAPAFRGKEARWQEWYFKFRAYIMCIGDRYPDLVTAEDVAQRAMDTALWDPEQIQVSRHLHLILMMLTEDASLRIVQAAHDSNEAEARRLKYQRCNPQTQEGMLREVYRQHLTRPTFATVNGQNSRWIRPF